MKLTNQSDIGWMILNGSGWNRHRTAETLEAMNNLPEIPVGYGVLVAPISDKPFGLRCALVKVLPRATSPVIGLTDANHKPIGGDRIRAIHDGQPDKVTTIDDAVEYLTELGFTHRIGDTCIHSDGTIATIEICDDGCEGDPDQWAYDKFGVEVERIYSCKAEQQSDDDSAYFIAKIKEALKKL